MRGGASESEGGREHAVLLCMQAGTMERGLGRWVVGRASGRTGRAGDAGGKEPGRELLPLLPRHRLREQRPLERLHLRQVGVAGMEARVLLLDDRKELLHRQAEVRGELGDGDAGEELPLGALEVDCCRHVAVDRRLRHERVRACACQQRGWVC